LAQLRIDVRKATPNFEWNAQRSSSSNRSSDVLQNHYYAVQLVFLEEKHPEKEAKFHSNPILGTNAMHAQFLEAASWGVA
jgi:hypothetical protein